MLQYDYTLDFCKTECIIIQNICTIFHELVQRGKYMSNIIKINKITAINCFDISPNFYLGEHMHNDWEFIYADSGKLDYISAGKRYTLSRGEIVFHPPGALHETICDGKHSASFFNMIFNTKSRCMSCFKNGAIRVPSELIPLLKAIITESERAYVVSSEPLLKQPDAGDDGEQIVRSLTELFLLQLRRHLLNAEGNIPGESSQLSGAEFPTDAVSAYLADHISEQINLDELAQRFYFGKTYLCVNFKKKTGKSIIDSFLDMKIAKAKVMLREENTPIQIISESLGFSSAEYFSRVFKKRVGYSPTDFRNKLITGTKVVKE